MPSKPTPKRNRVTYPLALTKPLYQKVARVAASTGMSRQAVMALSLERGLDVLTTQLSSQPQDCQP
jgi:hypothetical protein